MQFNKYSHDYQDYLYKKLNILPIKTVHSYNDLTFFSFI